MGKKKRVIPYSSSNNILLVGEGDFSFALSLARKFGTAKKMVATSRDSRDFLERNYANALDNLTELESRGCKLVHGVNVNSMAQHSLLSSIDFDRIVFNFPHAGFIGRRETEYRQIKRHKKLLRMFFKNAKFMLSPGGEIHVTHQTGYPYSEWEIVELAENENLILVREEVFDISCYPGYTNKKRDGRHIDRTFYFGESSTFIFVMGF